MCPECSVTGGKLWFPLWFCFLPCSGRAGLTWGLNEMVNAKQLVRVLRACLPGEAFSKQVGNEYVKLVLFKY